jgi:hypothetical protein
VYHGVKVVPLKQCSSCAREIPETATLCDSCSEWAADVAVPPAATDAPAPATAETMPTPSAAKPASSGRGLLVGLGAVAAVGVLAFAMLSARGSSDATPAGAPTPAAGASAAPAAKTVTSATQTWSTANRAYWVGHRPRSTAFELLAENRVPVWMRTVQPALVVRCMSKSIQAFVVTESALKIEAQTEDHTVTFGFDDEPTATEQWPDSEEHDALFAPDGAAFADRVMQASTLRFSYTPHNANPVTVIFNVSGLAPLIEPAAKECGWRK